MKGWRKIFCANGHDKRAGETFMSDKIDIKMKVITRGKEGLYIILKGVVQQKDITPVNIYVSNIGAPKYRKKILEGFNKGIDSNAFIAGHFNTLLSTMDSSAKQKNQQEHLKCYTIITL